MSTSDVFPLASKSWNVGLLPGKLVAKSEDSQPFSALFILSLIFWYGVGLSLLYDITESLWHWPHLAVIAFYGGMLVASTWLSRRFVKFCSLFTAVFMFAVATHAMWMTPTSGIVQQLSIILSGRTTDYSCWFFVMGCSILGRLSLIWIVQNKEINLGPWLAFSSFLLGCAISILPQVCAQYTKGDNLESIITGQSLNLVWLLYWAMPMKYNEKNNEGFVFSTIRSLLRLPKRSILFIMGALSYVFYDWACQYLSCWLQIIWFFAPVVIYFYVQNRSSLKTTV